MAKGTGYLSPFDPKPKDDRDTSGSHEPSEEEIKLVKQVDKLFERAAKHRRQYDKNWVEDYRFYRGDQWARKRPTYKNKDVINFVYSTIQSQSSVMMDIRPIVSFTPREPSDLELAEILNQVYEADYDKNGYQEAIAEMVLDGNFYGIGFGHTYYDPDAHNGEGSICFRSKDPFDLYPDPDATDVNKEGDYLIDATPKQIDKIKKQYSESPLVHELKPDLEDLSLSKRKVETLHVRRSTDLDVASVRQTSSVSLNDEVNDKALVICAYLKPNDTEVIERKEGDDSEAATSTYITRLKFPKGRKIIIVNQRVIKEGDIPYDDKEFPFCRYVNSILPREFFGVSEVENIKSPQETFNKILNFSLDVLHLMGNPVWLNPIGSQVESTSIINRPNLIIEHAPNLEPKRVEGVGLQPFVFGLIDRMVEWFNNVSGTQDVARGVNPTGVTANAAIENLLEQAQKRVKQKIRNLDKAIADHGRQWLSRCFQYYDSERVFRLTNKEGANKYFKFHVEQRPVMLMDNPEMQDMLPDGTPRTKRVAVYSEYKKDLNMQWVASETKEFEIRADFDVKVNTVSGLPFSKAENETKVFNLFDRQIIDAQEVLTRLEYPNREAILARMKDQQAQMAAQEQGAVQNG